MRRTLVALVSLSFASPALAEGASDAHLAWSAWECATFAGYAGEEAEQSRLFQLGYGAGRRYVEALRAGRITNDEIQNEVPIGVSLLMSGPSTDFVLGRVFSAASDDAFDKLRDQTNDSTDAELKRLVASNLLRSANCSLLR